MFKTRFALAAALLWIAGPISSAYGQPARAGVEVLRLTEGDLERTAHRLRISPERLQQARQALEEATDLAQEIEVQQLRRGGRVSSLWVRIHRLEAPDRLEALITKRSGEVSGLEEASQYQALTQWALQTASAMASLHPSRALQAVQAWPAPPRWLGEQASQLHEQLQSGLQRDEFPADFSIDPVNALRGLLGQASGWNRFSSQFNRIRRSQSREEANRLIDAMLTELAEKPATTQSLWQYSSLVQQANTVPHDRTEQLHDSLIAAFQHSSEKSSQVPTFIYEAEGQTVELNQGEHYFLQTLRSFYLQPEAILKLVNSWPDLKEKIDRIGGLDRAVSAGPTRIHNPANPEAESRPIRDRSTTRDLIQELKFEALSRPGWVNRRLDSLSEDGADP
ncbi:MAG: hypothetical protein V3T83_20110, partial [Acidobacteriota bacterium]